MTPLQEALEWAKAGVKLVEESFQRPDDDFAYVVLVLGPGTQRLVLPLDPEFFGSRAGQERLAKEHLPGLIRQYKPLAMAIVCPAWELDPKLMGAPLELIERAHGQDAVMICVASAQGYLFEIAMVTRHDHAAASVGKWETPGGTPGNVAEAMVRAFRELAA